MLQNARSSWNPGSPGSVSGQGRCRIVGPIESWNGDLATNAPVMLIEGLTVSPSSHRPSSRDPLIQRSALPGRFQTQLLIAAYEPLSPSPRHRGSTAVPAGRPRGTIRQDN